MKRSNDIYLDQSCSPLDEIEKGNSESIEFVNKEDSLYIRRFLISKLYHHHDIDDALQTTLLESYRSRDKFRGDSCKKVWICGIAMNIAKQFNRKYSSRKKVESTLPSIYSDDFIVDEITFMSFGNAEEAYALHEMVGRIEESLSNLGPEYRDVFSDVVLTGLSYQNAAEKYSLPIGTIKSRISCARAYLRKVVN